MNPSSALFPDDVDHVLQHTASLWEELRGQRIFITGGTGFVGCWLLESFARANDQLKLQAEAVVLTRRPESFQQKAPHLARHPAIRLLAGDVRDFDFPKGTFSHVIHAATDASAKLIAEQPQLMHDTIVQGTRRTLDFAVQSGAKKFLFVSSGAVYGTQPPSVTHLAEEDLQPGGTGSAYADGKRMGESLCEIQEHGLETKIARCFAFVGPHLPLDAHYAVGNFIGDGLRGGPIRVAGDGAAVRSYLYAADLAIWLWTILFRGASGRAYNVGSETDIAIAQLAHAVRDCFVPPPEVQVAGRPDSTRPASRYVPSTRRAREELGLTQKIELFNALKKTILWHQRTAVRE